MDNKTSENDKKLLKDYPSITSAHLLDEEELGTVLGGGCKEGCEPGGKFDTPQQNVDK